MTTTPGCCWCCCCWSSSSPSSPGCARDTICILASIRSGSSDVRRSVRGGGDGCRDDADGDSGPPRSPRASLSVFFGGRCEMGRCWSVAEDEDDGDDAAGLEPSPGRAPYTMHWFSPSTNVRTSGAVPAAFLSSGASCCPDRQPSVPSSRDLRSASSPRSPCASPRESSVFIRILRSTALPAAAAAAPPLGPPTTLRIHCIAQDCKGGGGGGNGRRGVEFGANRLFSTKCYTLALKCHKHTTVAGQLIHVATRGHFNRCRTLLHLLPCLLFTVGRSLLCSQTFAFTFCLYFTDVGVSFAHLAIS